MSGPSPRLPPDAPHGFGGTLLDRGRPLRFRLDGRPIDGFAGDTILSAALAAGIEAAGTVAGEAIALDERFAPPVLLAREPDQRRALPMERTPAVDGLDLVTVGRRAGLLPAGGVLGRLAHFATGSDQSLRHRFDDGAVQLAPWRILPPETEMTVDVLVVGGGVAGLSAARAATPRERVLVVERRPRLGGAARFFGAVENEEEPGDAIDRLVAQTEKRGNLEILLRAEVFALAPGTASVHLVELVAGVPRGRVITITARRIVLATGAIERLPVFPGNRMPRVASALGAYDLARDHGVWPGREALVSTSHSFAYRLALRVSDAGVRVQRIVDSRLSPHSRYIDFCKAGGITIASGQVPARLNPVRGGGLSVGFTALHEGGSRASPHFETDRLIAGGDWQPELSLWLLASGAARWTLDQHRLLATGELPGIALAGSAAGYRSLTAVMESGRAAMLGLHGKATPVIVERELDAQFETPGGPTPVAPWRDGLQAPSFFDRGATLTLRRAATKVAALPFGRGSPSIGDLAAAVETGAIPAAEAGGIATERMLDGGELSDTGWRVSRTAPEPVDGPPPVPAYLAGRFGPRPQSCVVTVADSRFFEAGCLCFADPGSSDPALAIGVIYAAAPGGRSGGMALLEKSPPLGTTLYVRDTSGPVPVKVMDRMRPPKA